MLDEDVLVSANKLLNRLPDTLLYHSKEHTFDQVLPKAIELARLERFSSKDVHLMRIAAAFHDTGYLERYQNNEPVGAAYAEMFMAQSNCYSVDDVQKVKDAILNTSMKSPPKDKFQAVLRDADLSYIAGQQTSFLRWNDLLRQEALMHSESALHNIAKDDTKWMSSACMFMNRHTWYTDVAKIMYETNKEKNVSFLCQLLELECS